MQPRTRPNWDNYFINLCEVIKTRSPDPKTQVGACLVSPNHKIISTGYNGLLAGVDENGVNWSDREGEVYPQIVHSEVNALLYAGVDCNNTTMYCTHSPCKECLKLMVAAGVVKVIFKIKHEASFIESKQLAKVFGVCLEQYVEQCCNNCEYIKTPNGCPCSACEDQDYFLPNKETI